ncbi:beta strand repeat-containing protein [Humisphaera borealis]|uniref:Autotransporter-associated beta strand repeat-containing protein n=1 Tax=Humisphaera borealis TaxID=2807512 RepID=A0A7M2WZY4_9BACT|nr:autotransporter-associated beta strand repeat-containing protein [Humisphaera borealis]QOV91058.1 autotransporter-associated beta strand repeat-containing protein [Humisphaera borealis]
MVPMRIQRRIKSGKKSFGLNDFESVHHASGATGGSSPDKTRRVGFRRQAFAIAAAHSLAAVALTQFAASSAQATTYYWDNNGGTSLFGTAAGTWSSAGTVGSGTQGWSTDASGLTAPTGTITTASTDNATDSLNFGTATANSLLAGTVTVSGTVQSGDITFGAGAGAIIVSGGTINLTAVETITVNSAVGTLQSISSTLSGAGTNFTKAGVGLLALTHTTNTFNPGEITISGGILRIGNNTATTLNSGSYGGNITNNGTLQIWSSSNQTLSGIISGSGGINKAYGGSLTLSGANTYTGRTSFVPQSTTGFTVNVSSFNSVVGGTASSSLGAPTTVANGTIDVGSGTAQAGVNVTYTGSGEITDRVMNIVFNGTSSQTITANNTSGLLRFTSAFTASPATTGQLILRGTGAAQIDQGLPQLSSGGLNKNDAGTWTLGGSGLFTGATTIAAGTLSLSSATALQNSPFSTASVAGGASAGLQIATTTLTLGGITGSNTFSSRFRTAGGYTALTTLTLNPGTGATPSYASDIGNGNGSMGLTKTGVGTQTFTAAQTYTGDTSITAGTLAISSTGSLNNTAITVSNSGSVFLVAPGAGTVGLGTTGAGTAGATLNLNGSGTVFSMVDGTAGGTTNLQQQASFSGTALTLNNATLNFELSGATADKLALTNANATASVTGTNIINLTPLAALTVGSTSNLITTAAGAGGLSTGGTFQFATGLTTGVAGFGGTNYQVTLNNAANAVSVTVAAAPSTMTWTGQVLGNGATDASWNTSASTNWVLGTTPVGFANGNAVTFQDTNTVTAGNVAAASLAVVIQAAGVSPSATTFNNSAVNYTVSGGGIGGTGGLTKSGSGTVSLTTANTYTGPTIINDGRLQLGNGGASGTLSTSSTLTVNAGGNLAFNNNNADFTVTAGTQFASAITGAGSLTMVAGSISLQPLSGNYSGGFTLLGGTVYVGANASAIGTGTLTLAGGTFSSSFTGSAGQTLTTTNANIWSGNFSLNGRVTSMTWNNNGTVLLSGGSRTVTGVTSPTLNLGNIISDGGNNYGLTFTTMTAVTLSGANTYGGGTTMNSGTLNINNSGTGGTSSAIGTGALNLGGATIDSTSGSVTLSTNNVFNFTANTIFTGTNSLSNGTGNFTINGTRTITVSANKLTLGGNQTNVVAGGIVKAGAGTLALLGSGVQTGAATISAGVLEVGVINNAGTPGGSSVGNVATAAANLLMSNGTTLRYVGSANATTDRAFTINGTAAGDGATIESSGVGTLSYTGAVALAYGTAAQTRTLTLGGTNTGANTFGKVIANNTTGATTLTKSGVGTWVLSANNTYTGGTNINAGILNLGIVQSGTGGPLGGTGTVASLGIIAFGGGTLQFSASNTTDYSSRFSTGATQAFNIDTNNQTVNWGTGNASSGGTLTKLGLGTLNITTGSNAFTGATTINGGTLQVTTLADSGTNSGIGKGDATAATLVFGGGTLLHNAANVATTNRLFTIGNASGLTATLDSSAVSSTNIMNFTNTGALGLGGSGARTLTLQGSNIGSNALAAVIGDGAGGVTAVVKSGLGTWSLTNANTYSGGTTITAGTLLVNNTSTLESGTGTGALQVDAAGTIGGSGSIAGPLTLAGAISPGNSVGTLTTANETWSRGGSYVWEIKDANGDDALPGNTLANQGTSWDLLEINGTLNIDTSTGPQFTIFLKTLNNTTPGAAADFNPASDYTWTIARTTSGVSNFNAALFSLDTSGFVGETGDFAITESGGNINISYTAVPEPGSIGTLAVAGIGLLARRRGRRLRETV